MKIWRIWICCTYFAVLLLSPVSGSPSIPYVRSSSLPVEVSRLLTTLLAFVILCQSWKNHFVRSCDSRPFQLATHLNVKPIMCILPCSFSVWQSFGIIAWKPVWFLVYEHGDASASFFAWQSVHLHGLQIGFSVVVRALLQWELLVPVWIWLWPIGLGIPGVNAACYPLWNLLLVMNWLSILNSSLHCYSNSYSVWQW